jgi:membrane protein
MIHPTPDSERASPRAELPLLRRWGAFAWAVVEKAIKDDIFFIAGAITFNLLIAVVPLLLIAVGGAGFLLRARFEDPSGSIVAPLVAVLPPGTVDPELIDAVRRIVERVIDERASLSVVGILVLVWISTRLVGTLRSVLRRVFEISGSRPVIRGKLFDAQMVVLGGAFILLNMGVTAVVYWLRDFGVSRLEPRGPLLWLVHQGLGSAVSFVSLWVLLILVYQFVAYGRVQWRVVLIASTITALITEMMKAGFAWYVSEVASFRSTYGSLAALAILFFYLYYLSVAFVLGGEIGFLSRKVEESLPDGTSDEVERVLIPDDLEREGIPVRPEVS